MSPCWSSGESGVNVEIPMKIIISSSFFVVASGDSMREILCNNFEIVCWNFVYLHVTIDDRHDFIAPYMQADENFPSL